MEKLWLKCVTKWLAESLCKQADAAYRRMDHQMELADLLKLLAELILGSVSLPEAQC